MILSGEAARAHHAPWAHSHRGLTFPSIVAVFAPDLCLEQLPDAIGDVKERGELKCDYDKQESHGQIMAPVIGGKGCGSLRERRDRSGGRTWMQINMRAW